MTDMIHGVLVLIGSVLIVIGVQLFVSSRKFWETGIKAQATVIDNIAVESRDNKGTSVMYTPLLEYDVKGEKKTYMPNTRSNPSAYAIGEKVPMVYSQKKSQDIRVISYWGIYMGSNILFALGSPMLVIGAGYFLFKLGII